MIDERALAYPGSIFSLTNHELFVVTAAHEERDNGQIATWIVPATLVPSRQRVVAVLSRMNFTHELISASGRFAINLLATGQEALVPLFGLYSGRDRDKFENIERYRTSRGLPVLMDTCGWAECVVRESIDAGDRMIYLADIEEQLLRFGKQPLRKYDAFALLPDEIRLQLEEKHRLDAVRDIPLQKRYI